MLVSKVGYWHTVPAERPAYGKRRKPVMTPRVLARRMIADVLYRGPSRLAYRCMVLKRLFRQH